MPKIEYGGNAKKDAAAIARAGDILKKEGFTLGDDNLYHHKDGRVVRINTKTGHFEETARNTNSDRTVTGQKSSVKKEDKSSKSNKTSKTETYSHNINGVSVNVSKNKDGSYTLEANGKKVKSDDPSFFKDKLTPRVKKALAKEVGIDESTSSKKVSKSSKSKTSASSIATVDDAATFLQKNVDKWREYQYEELDDEKLEKQFDEANKYIKDFKQFDWDEEDDADEYKKKMEKKGYKIVDLGEGSDTYIFAVLKKSKKK